MFDSDYANALTVQEDGKIISVGSTFVNPYFDFAMVRYNADGMHDLSFDNDGKVTTHLGIQKLMPCWFNRMGKFDV